MRQANAPCGKISAEGACLLPGRILFAVKLGVKRIDVFAVQLVGHNAQGFAKALEVYDFPRAQELDGFAHIGVVDQPQDVVIGYPCFLLCYKSNMQPVTVFPVTVMVRRARAASSKFCSGRASASADASLLWGAKAPGHRSGAA